MILLGLDEKSVIWYLLDGLSQSNELGGLNGLGRLVTLSGSTRRMH